MDFPSRLGWMILGCMIGFFAGYVVRYLQDMKEELDEVDGIVKNELGKRASDKDKDDRGFVRNDLFKDVMLLIVVIVTVWAAVVSSIASGNVKDTQKEQKRITVCNQVFLGKTVKALNERSEFTIAQAQANVDLQKAQAKFLTLLMHQPPYSQERRSQAASDYVTTLTNFVTVSGKSAQKAQLYPYPTDSELDRCYDHTN